MKILFGLAFLSWFVFLSGSGRAEVLGPGWYSVKAEPVSIQQAQRYYSQKARARSQLLRGRDLTKLSATEVTPEITALAASLQHNPKLIYEYVYNYVDYCPYFGSLKGAALTYLDGSGNDFDQASLMIALLRASGYTASYEYGTMIIPGYKAANWVGTGYSISVTWDVFAFGGIPIEIPNTSEVRLARVWVKASIEGKEYRFDPSLKSYTHTSKIDIGKAIGYNRKDLLASVAKEASLTIEYVQNLNEAGLSDKLVEYSSNLISTIRSQYPNSTVEEIVGGSSIVETTLDKYPVCLSFPTVLQANWDEVPAEYTATLQIKHLGIDYTFYTPQIAGKRLSVTYAGSDFHPELRLDGELAAAGGPTTLGSKSLVSKL